MRRGALASVKTKLAESFSSQGPSLFNSIPREIRNMEGASLDAFKRALDRFLARVPDEPPVPGYTSRAVTNSIPHQLAVLRSDGLY